MSIFNASPAELLEIVKGKILDCPLKAFRKQMLLDDINLAIRCFGRGDIQCVLNSLEVIVTKLNSCLFGCGCKKDLILGDIQILLQKLLIINDGNVCPVCPVIPVCPVCPENCPPSGNLIINGDFETSTTSLTGWNAQNAEPRVRNGQPVSNFFEGNVVAVLGSPSTPADAFISQTFNVEGGCPYRFTFAASSNPAGPELQVSVTCNGQTIINRRLTTLGMGYNTFSYLLTIPENCQQATVTFTKTGSGEALIDLVTFGSD